MTTDVNSLALDMLTFSGLLRIIRQPQLAENYEARAKYLLSNPAAEDVEETRAWVRLTLQGGAGGLGDTYVHKTDGAVDEVLNQQYQDLLQKMTDFALDVDEPLSLLQQMGNTMFAHGYTYLRLVEVPTGRWPFRRGTHPVRGDDRAWRDPPSGFDSSGWCRRLRRARHTTGYAGVPDDGTPPFR